MLLHFKLVYLITTWAVIEKHVSGKERCPRYCYCYVDATQDMRSVSCVGQRLDNIDLAIPSRAQVVDLSNNSISTLEDRAFQTYGLQQVVKLVVRHNSIQTISLHGFAGMYYLQWLDLTGNSLYQILPRTFHDNTNLRFISLSDNPLGHVTHPGPLLDIPSLEILMLSKCHFAYFAEEAFSALPNLRILDISENQLISFDVYPIQMLQYLQELNISRNPWQCNEHLEDLSGYMESRSIRLIGSSCDIPEKLETKKKSGEQKYERMISIGSIQPEYESDKSNASDDNGSSEEDSHEIIKSEKESNCSSQRSTVRFHKEYFILSPTLLSLVSFQMGVCVTLFVGYLFKYSKKKRKRYHHLMPETINTTEREMTPIVVNRPDEAVTQLPETTEILMCPETPPPSYRELFLTPR